MAIQPLQLPGPLIVPQIDWSPLNAVGDAYVKNLENQKLAAALGGLTEELTQGPKSATSTAPTTPASTIQSALASAKPTYPRIPYEGAPEVQPGQLPRGLRNNNPGNIEDGPLAKALPGYAGSDGRFAKFDTPENGLNAMDALLTSYGRRGLKTVGEVIGRWAPASDNNNVEAYARFVSPNGDPNAPIDLSDPAQRKQLIGKMGMYENGMHGAAPGQAPVPPPTPAQVADATQKMTPELAKRVQALAAVGSPAATQLAIGIISKYIGKQEPIIIPRGGMAIHPQTGAVIASNPEARFQLKGEELPSGAKGIFVIDTNSGKLRAATPEELGIVEQAGGALSAPPGTNPRTYREEITKAGVKNQEEAIKSAKVAGEFLPKIDAAIEAYQSAIDKGAIGPYVGSAVGRIGGKFGKTAEEEARQNYETAIAPVQALTTALQNKGEGAVSNFERQMYARQLPDVQALNPKEQIKFLKQMREDARATIEGAKQSPLSQHPSVVTERPPVVSGEEFKPKPAPTGPTPAQIKNAQANAQANIDAARAAIANGKDRAGVVERLRQFQIPIPPDL